MGLVPVAGDPLGAPVSSGSGPQQQPQAGPPAALPTSWSPPLRLSLLRLQGIRIPTLGSFDVVPTRIQVGKEVMTVQRPVFRLARNIVVVHGLVDDKDYLLGTITSEALAGCTVGLRGGIASLFYKATAPSGEQTPKRGCLGNVVAAMPPG